MTTTATEIAMYQVLEYTGPDIDVYEERMSTCSTAGDALVLARQWKDEYPDSTVIVRHEGDTIASL